MFKFIVRPACDAAVKVTFAATETRESDPLIKPAVDVTGPENVVEAIVFKQHGTFGERILDTRKTTPGWRSLEKYAVRCGGGRNHRQGLYDAVLIKDSHIAGAGGITAAIVPQQADTFNIGLRFTQGVQELPGIIEEVRAQGAELIVVQSELGLAQNLKIAQSFADIDVMYSAHTHEITLGALLATKDEVTRTTPGKPLSNGERKQLINKRAAIVVETNRDMYVGRLDLEVSGGQVIDFTWDAIPVDGSVPENTAMAELVAAIEEPFVAGEDGEVQRHTFMPGGFCTPPSPQNCGDTTARGLQLVDDLDTAVGVTDTLLLRHHVLEDVLNNFIADAIRYVANSVSPVDMSMANGFRFGNAVLPASNDCDSCGIITLRDLYTWFPIAPAVNVAEFSGQSVQRSLDTILGAVFDRNPFLQRGGWYLGLANMKQKIDLDNRPFSSSSGRIVETTFIDSGEALDPSKRYVFASCYGHGNPLDEVCRTGGGAGFQYYALADVDDYNSGLSLVPPVSTDGVITGTTVKQVAPDNFLHPVHALRRWLDDHDNMVYGGDFAIGRIETVDSTDPALPLVEPPVPAYDPTLVQPPQGAGPTFFSGSVGQ